MSSRQADINRVLRALEDQDAANPVDSILDFLLSDQSQGGDVLPPGSQPPSVTEGGRPEGGGFLESTGNIIEAALPIAQLMSGGAPLDPQDRERLRGVASGTVGSALLSPIQALLEIPGLFTQQELASDRAADFVQRLREGVLSTSEESALKAGISAKEIADAHALGNFIGFTAPVGASLKLASLAFRMPVTTSKILTTGNLINDMIAGGIFGAVLEPAQTFDQRIKHLLRESAMFGVGRIIVGGIALPFTHYRNKRAISKFGEGEVSSMIERMRKGERVEIKTQDEAIGLAQLLNEEEMVASSVAAQDAVKNLADERALLHGVISSAESGTNAGIIPNIGRQFDDVVGMIDKFKGEFPSLKFDVIKVGDEAGYSVYFGQKGLSNVQKSSLKKHGLFPGQVIEKNGAQYKVVNPAVDSKGRLAVETMEGHKTSITAKGVTTTSNVEEVLDDTLMMDDLFTSFRESIESGWRKTYQSVQGDLPEGDLIRMIRDGRLPLTDDARRAFDVSGAIVYPEELGLAPGRGLTSVSEVAQQMLRDGTESARLLTQGGRVLSFEDLFDAWARNTKLPANAPDYLAMKAHFAQRMREYMWKQVPAEDMAVFNAIRDEFFELSNKGELPFEAIAHNKGFSVDALTGGRVELRDVRTGMRIPFGSEQRARDFVNHVIRSEKNMLGDPFNMGSGGIAAIQRGFAQTDGIFNMDGTIPGAKRFLDDISGISGLQNLRDHLIRIEDSLGVPLFSKVFDGLDLATSNWHRQLEPWANRIESVWKGLSSKEAIQVGRLWAELEGDDLTLKQAVRLLKDKGLSTKQIEAFKQSREIFDTWFQLTGIENERFINLYYTRIRPYADKHGGQIDLERIFGRNAIPPEYQFFAELSRTGDMAMQELNPAIVMHQYARSLFFKREVSELFNQARRLVDPKTTVKFGDLSIAQREAIETAARRTFRDQDIVLADPIRKILSEYLNIVRGMPTATQQSVRDFATRFFKSLGIEVEGRVIDEMTNIGITSMYGAAMAFRPSLVARNTFQTLWTLYPRLGGKWYSRALERATTVEGAEEAIVAGAIRASDSGIPFQEQVFTSLMDRIPIKGTGPVSKAFAATMRGALHAGDISRSIARKGLAPYSSSDGVERATAYWWQKLHTDEVLKRYEAGKITWDKFVDEGLPFFHDVTIQKFAQRYNRLGREDALRWISKQAADEANFIYGAGAQPGWMQNAVGRLASMFGTWPMWAAELYLRRLPNGTIPQQAAFVARTAALVGAFSNMTMQTGYNLWNWIAPFSMFSYAGGPSWDILIQAKRVIESPIDQKADAMRGLAARGLRLSLPGQVAFREVADALDQESPAQAAFRMMLGRPDDSGGNWATDVIYDPQNTGFRLEYPESESALRSLEGLNFPRMPSLLPEF